MAIYKEDIADVELTTGTVHRSFLLKAIGEGDADAYIFGVRVWRSGESVNLAGSTVVGYFIRADGTTEVINGGAASGNLAMITLPAACCSVEGNFSLAIKVTGGGVTGTLRIVDGTVVNTVAGAMADPGSVIPDLSDLLAVISRAEDAAAAIAGYSVTAELIDGENYEIIVTTVAEEE